MCPLGCKHETTKKKFKMMQNFLAISKKIKCKTSHLRDLGVLVQMHRYNRCVVFKKIAEKRIFPYFLSK